MIYTSLIHPFKTKRKAFDEKTFNVKYPKTSRLKLDFTEILSKNQKIDIHLKRALSKKLLSQNLTILFQLFHPCNQIQNYLAILIKSLSKFSHIKSLTLKLNLNQSLHNFSRGFIQSFLPKLRNLKSLHITYSSSWGSLTKSNLIKNIRKLPQLRHLTLSAYLYKFLFASCLILSPKSMESPSRTLQKKLPNITQNKQQV